MRIAMVLFLVLSGACGRAGETGAAAKSDMAAVRAELGRIPAPRDAQLLEIDQIGKANHASARYRSGAPRVQTAQHYLQVMQSDGWRPCGEIRVHRWGQDRGDRELSFRKGDLSAYLFFGDEARYGFNYSLTVRPSDRRWTFGEKEC